MIRFGKRQQEVQQQCNSWDSESLVFALFDIFISSARHIQHAEYCMMAKICNFATGANAAQVLGLF